MDVKSQIADYLNGLSGNQQGQMRQLHGFLLEWFPGVRLWFSDGRNEDGKIVSNPSIGYGHYWQIYANGSRKELFQIGISSNKTGISIYVLGIKDKHWLSENFSKSIGKAIVTGYCIKFRILSDISLEVLKVALQEGVRKSSTV
ncbi:MAG: DUF1801 domain-containing protein [Bacteroidia bacterium]|nr:DUF1801 domain-containing protein [Bacteroidia bacterium]